MFGTRSQGKVYNFVHTDEIWKDHVMRELQSQKKWREQWGYLLEEYHKLQENLLEIGKDLEQEKLQLGFEQQLNDLLRIEEIEEEGLSNGVDTTDCCVKKTSLFLQNQRNNVRGRNDILKLLTWPREAML